MPPDTSKGSTETTRAAIIASRGRRLLVTLQEKFTEGKNEKSSQTVLFLLTALTLTFLIVPSQHFHLARYVAGDIAPTDIKATRSYLLEDPLRTEEKRSEAERATPLVYNFHPGKGEEVKKGFAQAFSLVIDARSRRERDGEALREAVSRSLGREVTAVELGALERVRNFRALQAEIGYATDRIYKNKVVSDRTAFTADRRHGIILFESESGRLIGAGDATITVIDLKEAAGMVSHIRFPGVDRKEVEVLRGLIIKALQPNLTINQATTETKRLEARNSIRPVVYQIKRGEMIVREGERITDEQALKLNKIFEVGRGANRLLMGIGIFGLILVLFYFPFRFGRKNIRKFNPSSKDLLLLALLTIGFFLFLKIVYTISTAMGILFPQIGTDNYFYLFPFAAGVMLVRIILNSEIALVYCAVCAPLLGILFNNSLFVVIYALLGGIIGAHGVRQCQYRGTIYTAGLKVSVVNLALALPFQVLTDNLFTSQTLYIIIFALLGGLVN
ncbi:MAG: HD family phosphohydrolase, partial [Deltaproteobacteria bacterium]|nr:HD family phosphohydrolase [Deltaproteobacteria bacterium]